MALLFVQAIFFLPFFLTASQSACKPGANAGDLLVRLCYEVYNNSSKTLPGMIYR
jgi:hypothetical protein